MRRFLVVAVLLCAVAFLGAASAKPVRAQQTVATYVVQPGDTLFRISLHYGVPVPVLAAYNGIANPNLIYVGQVIRIPGGVPPYPTPPPPGPTVPPGATAPPGPTPPPGQSFIYVVQPGDTLYSISRRFGVSVQSIVSANGIANPNLIYVGQHLIIPTGGVVVTPGGPTPPPPPPGTGNWGLGGQVQNLDANAQTAVRTSKMSWVKRQLRVGDDSGGAINEAHSDGFKILLSVIGDKNSVLNPGYFDTFASYVGQAAAKGADAIEVWNEQNLDREWPNGQINPATYTQLLAKSYAAIKAANPATIVISGAPAPTGAAGSGGKNPAYWNDDVYYQGMAAAGAGNYADCIGVHYNEGIVPPAATSGDPRGNYPTRYFTTMLNRALAPFPGKKACFTEIGYLSPEGFGPLPPNFAWAANTTVADQAAWLAQAASIARNGGRTWLFMVFNVNFTYYGPDDPQAGYAIIRPNGSCPACLTLGALPQ